MPSRLGLRASLERPIVLRIDGDSVEDWFLFREGEKLAFSLWLGFGRNVESFSLLLSPSRALRFLLSLGREPRAPPSFGPVGGVDILSPVRQLQRRRGMSRADGNER